MIAFDAEIGLTKQNTPPGMRSAEALDRVKQAIEALPGAGNVSVTWCSRPSPTHKWVLVCHQERRRPMAAIVTAMLEEMIEVEVRLVLYPAVVKILPH
jgi:hypothetical protein